MLIKNHARFPPKYFEKKPLMICSKDDIFSDCGFQPRKTLSNFHMYRKKEQRTVQKYHKHS